MTGWKTILVAVLQFIIYLFAWEELVNYLDPQIIAMVSAIAMIVLRFFTSTSVFQRK